MQTIKQISQTLEESLSLKMIAQAYTEIAAAKLQKIRAGIEANRLFFQEINEVLHIVKAAATQKHIQLPYQKSGIVSLILTSNHRFCGDIESKLIQFFTTNTEKFPTDRVVVGKTAVEHFKMTKYNHPVQPFVFKEDLPSPSELQMITSHLTSYEQISVYYSRMENVLNQNPHVVDIAQKPPEQYLAAKGPYLSYIFEPELAKMLKFFDGQVISTLLSQTFLESEMARTASRLVSMDQAQLNADTFIKGQKTILGQAKMSQVNMQILETFSSLLKWRKKE